MVGDIQVNNKIVTFNEGNTAIIGNTFFKNYRLVLNWKENKIYMIEVAEEADSKYESFGIGLKYINNKATIARIFKGSAAEKSGLLINDQISVINDKNISNLNEAEACFYSFNSIFSGENDITITVLRDGNSHIFKLKKEVLLQ